MDDIYHLRYEVYSTECGFIKPEDHPNQRESDHYDGQSLHFAALNSYQEIIGYVRLILPGRFIFPIEEYCPNIVIQKAALAGVKYGEISRLVISKKLRRRKNDGLYYEPDYIDQEANLVSQNKEYLRRAKPLAFGLYRALYQESKRRGVTHWYSLMEKSLWLLLRVHGFNFTAIGEEVDVMGPVKPYIGKIEQIEHEIYHKNLKLFEYFCEDLEPQFIHRF